MPDLNDGPPSHPSNDAPSAIVLVIDRLTAGAIGPYGNTTIDTPEFNRWAASGILFDQIIANSVDLNQVYESWWKPKPQDETSLETSTLLFTDDSEIAAHPAADRFDQIQQFEAPESPQPDSPAISAADTQMATFFAQATEAIAQLQPGSLLWLHSKGISQRWDAPMDYRNSQCGPDDPPPPDFVKAPSQWIDPETADPDLMLGLEQAYAAQVILLDQLLNIFSQTLREDPKFTNTWLLLASPRGYPLGRHGVVGDAVDPEFAGTKLHQENLHVPLIVCPPAKLSERFATGRCGQLLQSSTLTSLLNAIFAQTAESQLMQYLTHTDEPSPASPKAHVATRHESATAIQTANWKMITDGNRHRLYSKPDDRWEVNDVANRCPIELEEMQQLLPD